MAPLHEVGNKLNEPSINFLNRLSGRDVLDGDACWTATTIEAVLLPLSDGRLLSQGWSPRCLPTPAHNEDEWAVLKTTAIQDGFFIPEENKKLPPNMTARPGLEVQPGDLLLTCAGPRRRCGIACLVRATRKKLMISGKMYRFRVPENHISPEYIEYFLRSADTQQVIDEMKTGISDSGLNLTHDRFFRLPIVVPPFPEQLRVVKKIDSLSSKSKRARQQLDHIPLLVERYRQAILATAFRGDLTSDWRRRNPANESGTELRERLLREKKDRRGPPNLMNEDELGALPPSWAWMPVEAITSKVVDGVHKTPTYVSDGIPFLTVKNLTAGPGISFAGCKCVTSSDHQEFIKRTNPEKGDILITKDGTLGVVRAIRTDTVFSIFVSLALVKPIDRQMTDYLELAFQSPQVQEQMVGVGTGLQHIHLTDLKRDFIPIAPKEERDEIVKRVLAALTWVDRLASEATSTHRLIDHLEQAILAKAFQGELVPQNPTDEPASVLLERIRAERAAAPGARRNGAGKRQRRA